MLIGVYTSLYIRAQGFACNRPVLRSEHRDEKAGIDERLRGIHAVVSLQSELSVNSNKFGNFGWPAMFLRYLKAA